MKYAVYMSFLTVAALVMGSMLGNKAVGTPGFSWLGYSKTFAFEPGTFLDLDVIRLTFGISITISVAQILLIIVAIIVYYKTAPKLFAK
ncbi:MAG: DUF4321 domain-containing protein [Ruminococcus flavefaciens]|nr:DUF4321 domain-containing protein [Ruminococcus flavefaciens]MCM1229035.1 DUF4321 domain-containing protein [Ruminococcus flavefaciens]